MPERTSNPYRRDRAVIGGMERHRAWDQGYAAAQADTAAWLASDEAVERVAKHLAGPPRCYCPDDWRQPATHCPQHDFASWPEDSHRAEARAVLAALRGDGR